MAARLDIESLRVFTSVIDLKRVGLAAQQLNLTQSAVSHKIKRLENRVGLKLLRRNSQGFTSTAEGSGFLDYARRLVCLHDEMVSNYPVSNLQGKLVLGATEDATHGALARVLGQFRRSHPAVKLQIRIAQSLQLEEWLKDGSIDLAILQLFNQKIRKSDQILWRDRVKWVMSADYPVEIGDLVPFVSFSEHCYYRQAASQALKNQGRSLDIVFDCQSVNGVNEAVRQGIGVALITESVMDDSLVEVDAGLPEMPDIAHVIRIGSGKNQILNNDLCTLLHNELMRRFPMKGIPAQQHPGRNAG
jgi:DNA-binding transcriptional LysR family regulator